MNHKIKTALVTGASRGLGEALAIELAKCGVQLVLVSRHQAEIDEVVAKISRLGSFKILCPLTTPQWP